MGPYAPTAAPICLPCSLPFPRLLGPRHSTRNSARAVKARTVGLVEEEVAMAAPSRQEGNAQH